MPERSVAHDVSARSRDTHHDHLLADCVHCALDCCMQPLVAHNEHDRRTERTLHLCSKSRVRTRWRNNDRAAVTLGRCCSEPTIGGVRKTPEQATVVRGPLSACRQRCAAQKVRNWLAVARSRAPKAILGPERPGKHLG